MEAPEHLNVRFRREYRNCIPARRVHAQLSGSFRFAAASDFGYSADYFGDLRLLLREGDAIGSSTVRNFTVLSNVLGSPAQARYNDSGNVIVKVTDAAGAQHLVLIAVP